MSDNPLDFDGLDGEALRRHTAAALKGGDDGELFIEAGATEQFLLEDGVVRRGEYHASRGFGLRGVSGAASAFAHADALDEASLKRAAACVREGLLGMDKEGAGVALAAPANELLYPAIDPIAAASAAEKVAFLRNMDSFIRKQDERIVQITLALALQWQEVQIIRADGQIAGDKRPLARLHIQLIAAKGERREAGMAGLGGRMELAQLMQESRWQGAAREAVRQALVNLDSRPAPAGEMDVVLGAGWPGILLHEAIGHGLEGDFHRKKTSAFTGLEGERIAAKGITVVDDATLKGRRGSLAVDDEGTPGQRTTLIEDGRMTGCLQDRLNSRLMGQKPTGNGRRESYRHLPYPRMTNTFMLAGGHAPEEIIASVKKGIYAPSFGGGQVDITSGKFVFSCTEAYEIENGKLGKPLKGAMLTGSGAEVLKRVSMVGNDLELDPGMGTCGKEGQSVPVGVGQPTLLVNGLTVGGTQAA